jgi:uncharacterized protein YcfJ
LLEEDACSAVWCCLVKYSVVKCSVVQYSMMPSSAVLYYAVQYSIAGNEEQNISVPAKPGRQLPQVLVV